MFLRKHERREQIASVDRPSFIGSVVGPPDSQLVSPMVSGTSYSGKRDSPFGSEKRLVVFGKAKQVACPRLKKLFMGFPENGWAFCDAWKKRIGCLEETSRSFL
jgi:hypothetical protein